jgi:lysozyme
VIGTTLIASIVAFEGYRRDAYIPIPGDVVTIGIGKTGVIDGKPIELGDTITQKRAEQLLLDDLDDTYAQGVKDCVTAPLYSYEFESFVSLTYNIGVPNFCSSTLVKKVNALDYHGACTEIKRWVYAQGEVVQGLVNRREKEYATCIGENQVISDILDPVGAM